METHVQFLAPGDVFMSRGQRHVIDHVQRLGVSRQVGIQGRRDDGECFSAHLEWGETLEVIDTMEAGPGAQAVA